MGKDDEFLQDSITGMSGCFEIHDAAIAGKLDLSTTIRERDMNFVANVNARVVFFLLTNILWYGI